MSFRRLTARPKLLRAADSLCIYLAVEALLSQAASNMASPDYTMGAHFTQIVRFPADDLVCASLFFYPVAFIFAFCSQKANALDNC
jgi:hypothetical protein